jgi:hypothetical protein
MSYSNAQSRLESTRVQDAIDELARRVEQPRMPRVYRETLRGTSGGDLSTLTAGCRPGDVALGGGCSQTPRGFQLAWNELAESAYQCAWRHPEEATPIQLTATVVCMERPAQEAPRP